RFAAHYMAARSERAIVNKQGRRFLLAIALTPSLTVGLLPRSRLYRHLAAGQYLKKGNNMPAPVIVNPGRQRWYKIVIGESNITPDDAKAHAEVLTNGFID